MITIKSDEEIKIMAEGGVKLGRVKNALKAAVAPGIKASEIDNLAVKLIKAEGAEVAFSKVKDYRWATCINVNESLVHGIPHPSIIFKEGDVVSIDVGVYHKGFYTDTSVSVAINPNPEVKKFINIGKMALEKAIAKVKIDNYIYDISKAIEDIIEGAGYSTVKALVGHGVGKELHEDPQIPCFVPGNIKDSPKIKKGMVLAVEVMYAVGSDKVAIAEDGWTIVMRDGKISALFEETVAVTENGPKILTL